jgi:hypothetical protein
VKNPLSPAVAEYSRSLPTEISRRQCNRRSWVCGHREKDYGRVVDVTEQSLSQRWQAALAAIDMDIEGSTL